MAAINSSEQNPVSDITETVAKLKIQDVCSFESISRTEGLAWLKQFDVRGLDRKELSDEEIKEKLRLALWDSQRVDCLFHGSTYNDGKPLDVEKFSSWPRWKEPREEVKTMQPGVAQIDFRKDAGKLDGYVFRHFNLSMFSQVQMKQGVPVNPPKDLSGAWIGARNIMAAASVDLTAGGGNDCPFSTYYSAQGSSLIIQFIDVKQCPWPEPSDKVMRMVRSNQKTKFGSPEDGPIVPMLQTPKFPLLVVRYAYFERKPTDGSPFVGYLEREIEKKMDGASARKIRKNLEFHLGAAVETPTEHLKMLVRLLSFNSGLLHSDYINDLQSHWNIPQDAAGESHISFLVPCLRLRFRTLEEIETGIPVTIRRFCSTCEKQSTGLMMCKGCQSVYYCNIDCSKSHWPTHKTVCKFSKRLIQPNDPDLPSNKFYVSTRTVFDWVVENNFAVEQEAIKLSGSAPKGECPPNEYGDEKFIVRIQAPPDYDVNGTFKGQTVMLWDRRRSLSLRSGPGDPPSAFLQGLGPIPFHAKGHANLIRMITTVGICKQVVFLWARRIGDCLEIDLTKPAVPDCMW